MVRVEGSCERGGLVATLEGCRLVIFFFIPFEYKSTATWTAPDVIYDFKLLDCLLCGLSRALVTIW